MSLGQAKHYYIFDSNTNTHYEDVFSLAAFCKENHLTESCMRDISKGRTKYQHKGFYCVDKNIYSTEIIKHKINGKRFESVVIRFNKLKKPFSAKLRYNQSDEYANFLNNIEYYYNLYHVSQKLSCEEIAKKINVSNGCIRMAFMSKDLKRFKFQKSKKGNDHFSRKRFNEKQKFFVDNFKEVFSELHFNQNKSVSELAKEYDLCTTSIFNYCRINNIKPNKNNISLPHKKILDFLTDNNIKTHNNYRSIISPKELDIFLFEYNIAIEINGLYWHSEEKIGKNYHLNKTTECENKNIQLLHFWDYEIDNKFDIIKSIINTKLNKNTKIYARKCVIRSIDSITLDDFCKINHIQGKRSTNINYGLYYNDNLVSCMSFIKNKKYQYELVRFCNILNTTVIGGANKLFKQFIEEYIPDTIVSYCDRRLFNGKLYENLNFTFSHNSVPNYWYVKDDKIYSRLKFQKHKLETQLEKYSKDKTESENMKLNGYSKIFDSGNKVFVYKSFKKNK